MLYWATDLAKSLLRALKEAKAGKKRRLKDGAIVLLNRPQRRVGKGKYEFYSHAELVEIIRALGLSPYIQVTSKNMLLIRPEDIDKVEEKLAKLLDRRGRREVTPVLIPPEDVALIKEMMRLGACSTMSECISVALRRCAALL